MKKNKKLINICLLILLLFLPTSFIGCGASTSHAASGSIRINEVMSSNSFFAALPDGSCYDWVELYNASDSSIDLHGYGLSDNDKKLLKWQIQDSLIIEPHGYQLIYLSGLNCIDEYGNIHANFRLSSKKGEKLYFSSSYGELIQELDIPKCDLENISYGIDERTDSDEYVWMSEPTPGTQCRGNTASDPEDLTFSSNGVVINEYMTNNSFIIYDRDGEYNDWVEVYNPADEAVSMAGYALSDSSIGDGNLWYFPDDTVLEADSYLLIFCSGKVTQDSSELHASFRLGSQDTSIALYSASGILVDSVNISELPENVSCGRDPESSELKLFSSPTPGTANSTFSHELTACVYGVPASDIIISETLSVSSSRGSFDCDYVELHNRSAQSISVENFGLSDTDSEIRFILPAVTIPAGGYKTIKCIGAQGSANSSLCAPFKLGSGGDIVYLTDSEGHLLDKMAIGGQLDGISRGRTDSEPYLLYYFTKPTPGEKNSSSSAYLTYAPQPVFSLQSGYTQADSVVYINNCEGCTIRYTKDGSIPTSSSAKYDPEKGIAIKKTCVIRAIAYKEGCLSSRMSTSTFFVSVSHSLPIVSLSSDPTDLFSDSTGIYSNSFGMYGSEPNYTSEEERNAVLEYFIDGRCAIKFSAGIRIFGESSRSLAQKSLAVMLSEAYGESEVSFPFFGKDGRQEFSSLVLRQSGQECKESKLRDELCTGIIKEQIECDCMDYTPVALYINGRYWGLYYIREKLNEDYLVHKYGFTPGTVDLIKSQYLAQCGSIDSYDELTNYIINHDMTEEKCYNYVCDRVDIDSLMDYWICETYFANNDTSNIRCYLSHEEGGKWRWMVFDLDNACYPYLLKKDSIYDHLLDPAGHGIVDECSNIIMRSLLSNKDFRLRFVTRYCHHLKTTFAPERTTAILDKLSAQIADEIPAQCDRWEWPTQKTWTKNIDDIRTFLNEREKWIVKYLKSDLHLTDSEFDAIYKSA